MALVQLPFQASYTFRDNNGQESTTSLYIPTTAAVADVVTGAQTIAGLLSTLSNAALVRATLVVPFEENAVVSPPVESEVERKLALTFRCVNGQSVTLSVPSPLFSFETAGTNSVLGNAVVVTAANSLIAGFPGGVLPVSNAGSALSRLEKAVIVHRYRKP